MAEYKISIIIPVYNVEPYIHEAMNSLLAQTIGFEYLQVIFVDDCSTDNSGAIIDEFARMYVNVVVVHLPENSGAAGVPRNEGMKRAKAEYLMFLDPDDYYTDSACEILYRLIELKKVDLVTGGYRTTDDPQSAKGERILDGQVAHLPENLDSVMECCGFIWSKIFRRSLVEQHDIRFSPRIPGQDIVFSCHYFLKASSAMSTNEQICWYRIRNVSDKSISYRLDRGFFSGFNECFLQCLHLIQRSGRDDSFSALVKHTLDFYYLRMLDSNELDDDAIVGILQEWQWLFQYYRDNGIVCRSEYALMVAGSVAEGDWRRAFEGFHGQRILRRYILDLENTKAWLEGQVSSKDAAIANLESAKAWLKGQVSSKNAAIADLENSKAWLEGQVSSKDAAIANLENAKVWLEGQVSSRDEAMTGLNEKLRRIQWENDYLKKLAGYYELPLYKRLSTKKPIILRFPEND